MFLRILLLEESAEYTVGFDTSLEIVQYIPVSGDGGTLFCASNLEVVGFAWLCEAVVCIS